MKHKKAVTLIVSLIALSGCQTHHRTVACLNNGGASGPSITIEQVQSNNFQNFGYSDVVVAASGNQNVIGPSNKAQLCLIEPYGVTESKGLSR